MNKEKTAVVFGATGMTGRALTGELAASGIYRQIRLVSRRPSGLAGGIVTEEIIADLSDPGAYPGSYAGDDIFICTGTTIKKAGSVSNMEKTDRDLPVRIAAAASSGGASRLAVVSSLGADPRSSNYYQRIKGQMEDGIKKYNFKTLIIVRPSLLMGKREEKRSGEAFARMFMKIAGPLFAGPLLRFRGIDVRIVARAMIVALNERTGVSVIESDELYRLGGS